MIGVGLKLNLTTEYGGPFNRRVSFYIDTIRLDQYQSMAWITVVVLFTLRTVLFLLSLAYNLSKLVKYGRVEARYKYPSEIVFSVFFF